MFEEMFRMYAIFLVVFIETFAFNQAASLVEHADLKTTAQKAFIRNVTNNQANSLDYCPCNTYECYDQQSFCQNGYNCCKYQNNAQMYCCPTSGNGCPNQQNNTGTCDGTWNVAAKGTIAFMVMAVLAFFAKK